MLNLHMNTILNVKIVYNVKFTYEYIFVNNNPWVHLKFFCFVSENND